VTRGGSSPPFRSFKCNASRRMHFLFIKIAKYKPQGLETLALSIGKPDGLNSIFRFDRFRSYFLRLLLGRSEDLLYIVLIVLKVYTP
jgi:hypothetical protein